MATDYSILEGELTDLVKNLKRDLHMHKVRSLRKKKDHLAESIIQRKRIEILEKQVACLEPTVSTLYSPQYALKDNEIMGYLIYLLKMKDFFSREVVTKQEMLNQKNDQIKVMLRKLCVAVNEEAKKNKNTPVKSSEFVRLENMSNKLNEANKRICTMRQENNEVMENILNMRKFQRQFRIFEREFRRKIIYLREKAQDHLDRAVAAYEEKDDCMTKERVFEERCAQDMRKTAINENALTLCLQRSERNTAFTKLQNIKRTDLRIAETGDMISKGITGLEPTLENMKDLQNSISAAAGEEVPEKMEDNFKIADDRTNTMFSYLDEVLSDIHQTQSEIDKLKEENRNLIKGMSSKDRKMRRDIKINKNDAQKKMEEADDASKATFANKDLLKSVLNIVQYLFTKICPDEAEQLESQPIDDSNVIDYLNTMEKELLDYLICLEYLRMKEASEEEKPLLLETEDDEVSVDEMDKLEDVDSIQPRTLQSETDLHSLSDMESGKSFLEFEDLKEKAVAAISEVQSGVSEDDEEY